MKRDRWAASLRLVGLGWYVAACIILGLLGGIWLDGKVHTEPLFTLLGLGIGIITAIGGMLRMLSTLAERDKPSKD
ncbi:MAG: AtpZ/AtpI family protein [Chloroflexi bacterium]|nr:AtpZ/AtpI family protein [Chloroflexota bacterium]